MAVRDDFSAGEVLAAADLNDTFAEKLPYSYGTATPTATDDGFLWYDSNSTPPDVKFWDGSAFQALGGGTILQVVRATDTSSRSTTSTSMADVSGMSVTITPQKSTSAIIVISAFRLQVLGSAFARLTITDASNNSLSGVEDQGIGDNTSNFRDAPVLVGYATPATTSAVTYKLRFRTDTSGQTVTVANNFSTGQMYAIEVAS